MIPPINELTVGEKNIAPESEKIQKARRKLLNEQLKREERITPEALGAVEESIRRWLCNQQVERVPVKLGALFAENKETAKTSKKVEEIARQIQESFQSGAAPSA